MAIIAVFNQKGGVGKTTTALNLLAAVAQHRTRPLGIDLDPQGHLSHIFGVQPRLADDTIYSFFIRQRPLEEIAQVSRSGVLLSRRSGCPEPRKRFDAATVNPMVSCRRSVTRCAVLSVGRTRHRPVWVAI